MSHPKDLYTVLLRSLAHLTYWKILLLAC